MREYKFCLSSNGYWWFCVSTLEQLNEYEDKTDFKYGQALVNGDEKNKYYQLAELFARKRNTSLLEGMVEVKNSAYTAKANEILNGKEIWINENGGFNLGLPVDKTIFLNSLRFPDYTKDDIKITQWGKGEGFHYYARIGTVEVRNGDVIKWDTFQEAYDEALKYISKGE